MGRVRLGRPPGALVERRHRERGAEEPLGRKLGERRKVAQEERRLRQHRARRAVLEHRRPDARHQPVARLDPLVGVGVGAERDVLARPSGTRKLAGEHLRRVDLDDDLALEVAPGVEVQIAVRRPREAVDAGVGAAAVGVHRPAERHRRALGDAIEHRARPHLVEAHVERLRRVEGPHHRVVTVPRQPVRGLPLECQVRPPHTNICSQLARTDDGRWQTSPPNCR